MAVSMRSNMPVVGIVLKAPREERNAVPREEREPVDSWPGFNDVVHRFLAVRSDKDFGAVVRGGLQDILRHEILIAAWGDFRLGSIHYDLRAADAAIEGRNMAADGVAPILCELFEGWVANGRQPLRMDVADFAKAWKRSGIAPEVAAAMSPMKSVALHGILDQRGHADCLYAFFSASRIPGSNDSEALRLLVPYIDVALRQVQEPTLQVARAAAKAADGNAPVQLSEREAEIMKWVAMGKTNVEIASILNLSSFTIKNHMQRIFKKLDVFNRAQAVSEFKSRHGLKR